MSQRSLASSVWGVLAWGWDLMLGFTLGISALLQSLSTLQPAGVLKYLGIFLFLQETIPRRDGHRQQRTHLTASTELCLIYGPFCSVSLHGGANLLQLLFQYHGYSFLVP